MLTIHNPGTINVIGFFMSQSLADDPQQGPMGACLYFSSPPEYQTMQFVGAIGNERPSDIFHTGWGLNPNVNVLSEIKLVVALEPLH